MEPAAIEGHKRDALRLLRGLGFLEDGEPCSRHPIKSSPPPFMRTPRSPAAGIPQKAAGDFIREGEALGEIRNLFGRVLCRVTAKVSGVILYQTASLGIEKGTSSVAYGKL